MLYILFEDISLMFFSVYRSIVGKCSLAAPIYLFKGGCREFTLVKPTLNK